MKKASLWLILLIVSCCTSKDIAKDFGPGAFTLKGSVAFLSIEGGCWQFKSDDGTTYQISGEQASFLQKDGLRAEIIVRALPYKRGICMAGKFAELLKIVHTD